MGWRSKKIEAREKIKNVIPFRKARAPSRFRRKKRQQQQKAREAEDLVNRIIKKLEKGKYGTVEEVRGDIAAFKHVQKEEHALVKVMIEDLTVPLGESNERITKLLRAAQALSQSNVPEIRALGQAMLRELLTVNQELKRGLGYAILALQERKHEAKRAA
ncbi:hypothetical protein HYS48_01605 [Candidatus Woesearchaeota archaeon]|nr:hypothetical protein [Candidatus Woesearchaeota archaeon]